MATLVFDAIGTRWQIDIFSPVGDSDALEKKVRDRIEVFDRHYSRFRSDSLVHEMATKEGVYPLPEDARKLFDFYRELYEATDGLVTPLIGGLMEDAGYDAVYSLHPKEVVRAVPSWEEAMVYRGDTLEIIKPVLLDVGAAGKGYLIDLVGALLEKEGVTAYTVDAGGDILHRGEAVRVGLEDPEDATKAIGIATIADGSICASATNRRRWGAFHHVMHPRTRTATEGIAAVWTVAASALVADGLATALFFVPPERLKEIFDFAYVLLNDDRSVVVSGDFPGEVFTS
ncbi:MAG TPA: FAD:protein FMN transferase [Candidatus Paceibacterota bacterium]|nr:FAD:protein FMN transferase [Candidatus Paceibacterota bacterium]